MNDLSLKILYSHNKEDVYEAVKHIDEYVLFGCDYFDLIGTSGKLINVDKDSFIIDSNDKKYFSSCIAYLIPSVENNVFAELNVETAMSNERLIDEINYLDVKISELLSNNTHNQRINKKVGKRKRRTKRTIH